MSAEYGDPFTGNALLNQALAYVGSAAVQVAARIGVADHLATQARTPGELAELTSVDSPCLERILRFLSSKKIFYEDSAGRFHLTPAGELLRSDVPGSLRAAVLMLTADIFWRPAGRLAETVGRGATIFDEMFHASLWEYLGNDPAAGELFDVGMANLSATEDNVVAESCDLSGAGTVVDVAGGRGGLLRALLVRNPQVTGILFDQAHVVREHLLDVPELAGRWQVESGSFFDHVPPGGDVYLLKHIIHDWNDEECVRILRNCRRAMADDGRVLVIDAALPPLNAPHIGKELDLLMMAILTGRERTEKEFERLFADADLELARVVPTATYLSVSIIEAVAA